MWRAAFNESHPEDILPTDLRDYAALAGDATALNLLLDAKWRTGKLDDTQLTTPEWYELMAMIDGLQPHERQELEALGAGPGPVRGAMEAENGAFERAHARTPGRAALDQRFEAILRELARVEAALQGQGHVYR